MYLKNVSGQYCSFQGVLASTGGIATGITWTVRRCIDGTFAAGGGTVTEDTGNGWYTYAMSQADTNGNNLAFNFTGSGVVPQTVNVVTQETGILKNIALPNFEILMTDSVNHNPMTGLTISVTRSIDGSAFSAGTLANFTEIGNGWYKFDFAAADLNGKVIGVRVTAPGADDLDFTIKTSS